jgi:post-segregation antitoxin (ccd killing protein)
VKRLRYFFNHIKEEDLKQVEQRASIQSVSEQEADQVTKWMEEATKAIAESKKFIELIDNQEV